MKIAVRRATLDDYPAIASLNAEVQQLHADALPHIFKQPAAGTFPLSLYSSILDDPRSTVILGEVDGEPAGYIYFQLINQPEMPFRYQIAAIHIHHIVIAKQYRRHGFGERLIQEAIGAAQANGIARVELSVWSFNTYARAFFTRQGFRPVLERMELDTGQSKESPGDHQG